MKKIPAWLAAAGAFVLVALTAYALVGPRMEPLTIVSANGKQHVFEVEIADTPQSRETGLMFRAAMKPDHGMLFDMGATEVTYFWMKNTLIPLDILFIAPDGTIKTIHRNAHPQDLTPIGSGVPVSAVLELNGGRTKALGIAPGDKVLHSQFNSASK